jgi:pimeloyl-ACP methyl ester carboxylesterase
MSAFTVRVGGRTIAVGASVRGGGTDLVVLLPGLGCTRASFDGAFRHAALSEFALCALDHPGHGGTATLGSASHLEHAAEVVTNVVEQLGADRVHLVGHSMGGAVGLIAARDLPSVGSFISIEGNLLGRDCGLASRAIARQPAADFVAGGFDGVLSTLAVPGRPDLSAWRGWLESCDREAVHAAARSLVDRTDGGTLVDLFRSLPGRSYVYGADSDIGHLSGVLAGERTHRVEDSGHFPMVDNPDRLYTVIADDLRRAGAATSTTRRRRC